jgi:hypothetical protein|tara:strand:- start:1561 stop:2277 length:717 start_codon:yes stop_codon:yes gene_type:complete
MKIVKNIIIISISIFLLSSCATTEWVNSGKSKTVIENVDFPLKGVEVNGKLGETLASKGYKSFTPAIRILKGWVWQDESFFFEVKKGYVLAGTEGELTSIMRSNKTGEEYECFYIKRGVTLCKDKNGVFSDLGTITGIRSGSKAAQNIQLPFSGELVEFTKLNLLSPTFIEEFIYNGRVNNALKFVYRQYSGDHIKPAFTQDVQYDLDQSNIIGFKDLKLQVTEATNTNIRYILLDNF